MLREFFCNSASAQGCLKGYIFANLKDGRCFGYAYGLTQRADTRSKGRPARTKRLWNEVRWRGRALMGGGVELSLVAITDIRRFKCKRAHGAQPTSEDYKSDDGGHYTAPFGVPRWHGDHENKKAEVAPCDSA